MADRNERIIEELTKEVEESRIEGDTAQTEEEEFHDAISDENDLVVNDSSDDESVSGIEDTAKIEVELNEEEIEVQLFYLIKCICYFNRISQFISSYSETEKRIARAQRKRKRFF